MAVKLTFEQLNKLHTIIQNNQSLLIAKQLGEDYLNESEKILLNKYKLNSSGLYVPENDTIITSFRLGALAHTLNDVKALDKLSIKQLQQYLLSDENIPLINEEKHIISDIKIQTLSDIKNQGGKILQSIVSEIQNNAFSDNKKIMIDLTGKVGEWKKQYDALIDYNSNNAYQFGRAKMIERDYGSNVRVYKIPQETACKHCKRLYLTKRGIYRTFILSELIKNGNNIGRKVDQWLPVVGTTHPHCKCRLVVKSETIPTMKAVKRIKKRKPIKMKLAGRKIIV